MTTLMVPSLNERPWPTLGPLVVEFIEENLVYGPGEKKGERYVVEPEFEAELYRMYEVYARGHRLAGRRRFKRCALSKRKGTAKTEKAMIIAAVEAHPDGPVRCDGFRRVGSRWDPVGRPVRDPYIPLVAYTKDQTEDLGFNVLRQILEESRIADQFDIGLDRILVLDGRRRQAGKIVPLAGSPSARDGALTSFQHFDETHRMNLPRLVKAHSTMQENIYKRIGADGWSLETTTMPEAGDGSVAEDTYDYALAVQRGEVDDPRLFFFHRQAADDHPVETPEQVRDALLEASGPAAEWSGDIDALVSRWFEPKVDREYYMRVWFNQLRQGGAKAFDPQRWVELAKEEELVDGSFVTLGFDGSRRKDATALVATTIGSGHQTLLALWERPYDADESWEVPASEVDAAVTGAFERFNVWRMYADPPYWDEWVDAWEGRYGKERVVRWWTNRWKPMAHALRVYRDAIAEGSLSHDGNESFARHIGNAVRKSLPMLLDDEGVPLWVIVKARSNSPLKIDAAMAGCLAWEARGDAIAAGAKVPATKSKVLRSSF